MSEEKKSDSKKIDETVPGGRYEVNGMIVDANGVEITKTEKPEKAAGGK